MSRIGKNPVVVPAGVTLEIADNVITVKGKLGQLTQEYSDVTVTKELELVGVGYRASNQGQKLDLALGFSHNIILEVAQEVKLETISEKGKNPIVKLTSHDKQLLGAVAAKIRGFRRPEPYKGKGVKFVGEVLRRKAGKSA
jgi:large subunit ribosomal protein L6